MKKGLAVLLALMMVLGMSMTAFASNSPDLDDKEKQEEIQKQLDEEAVAEQVTNAEVVKPTETAKEVDGDTLTVVVDSVDSAVKTEAPAQIVETVAAQVAAGKIDGVTADNAKDATVSVAAMMDISLEKNDAPYDLPAGSKVTFTFDVTVPKDASVLVLHWTESGVEVVPSEYADGKVTATFTSLSPVAIVIVEAKTAEPSNPPSTNPNPPASGDTDTPSSPDTADLLIMPVVLFAAVTMAAAVVSGKKARG